MLDASAWLAAYDRDSREWDAASALLVHPEVRLASLDLVLYEVVNVAAKQWGNLALAAALPRLIVRRCGHRLIRGNADLVSDAAKLVEEHGLSAYDAAYVAASAANGWQLVSTDHRDLVAPGLAISPTGALAGLSGR